MNDETKNELSSMLELHPLGESRMRAYAIGRILLQATEELSRIADALKILASPIDYDPRFDK